MHVTRSLVILVVATLVILACALLAWSYQSSQRETREIRGRYQQMRLALSSGDTNAARALFAPEFRGGAHRSFEMVDRFAKALGDQSAVRFSSSRALVCPERIFHFRVIPGGHTIEMVKVDGKWFFTGKVHID